MSFLDGLLGSPNISQAMNSSVSAATGAAMFLTAPSISRTKSGQFKLTSSVSANLSGSTVGGICLQFFSSLTGAVGPKVLGGGINGSAFASAVWIDSPSINVGQSITYSVEVIPTNASTAITLPNKGSSIVVSEEGGAPSGSGVIAVATSGGGTGGGAVLSSLASPFTMPAVGSTVVAAMIPGGGLSFQKNNAVNVNVSGAPSNFTVTIVSGDNVTLLNNGGPFNVAPAGTVPAASIVTVASTNAPIAAVNPLESQALAIVNGSATPTDMSPVINVRRFGCRGDNTTDNTTFINNLITYLHSLPANSMPRVYWPAGVYKTNGGHVLGTTPVALKNFEFFGDSEGQTFISYAGAAGGDVFIVQDVLTFNWRHIHVGGNNQARSLIRLKPFTTSASFEDCIFASVQLLDPWRKLTSYSVGKVIRTPQDLGNGIFGDNGHQYICLGGGSGVSAGTPPTFTRGDGDIITESTGLRWQENGISPVCVLSGDPDPNPVDGDTQSDNTTFTRCAFTGFGPGWRAIPGGNVKNFHFNHCTFQSCRMGIDWGYAAGSLVVDTPQMLGNDLDYQVGANILGSMTVTGHMGEGSACLLYGNVGSGQTTQVTFQGGYWDGACNGSQLNAALKVDDIGVSSTNAVGGAGCIMRTASQLTMEGLYFKDSDNPFPIFQLEGMSSTNSGLDGGSNGAFGSSNCTYHVPDAFTGPFQLPIFDSGNNPWLQGLAGSSPVRALTDNAIVSVGDKITNFSHTIIYALPEYHGQRITGGTNVLPFAPAASIPAGATPTTKGVTSRCYGGVGIPAVYTIPVAVVKAAAIAQSTTQSAKVYIAQPWNRTKIKAVYAVVTTAFAGVVGQLMKVGHEIPYNSGTFVLNAYLLDTDVTTTKIIGNVSGDLGADMASPVQGGAMVWGLARTTNPGTDQWSILCTFTAPGALLIASLNAGSVDIIVDFEVKNL